METTQQRKDYLKKWRKEHPKYMIEYTRTHRDKFNKSLRKWKKNNPDKVRENIIKDKERHKNKILSRARANVKKLRGRECSMCGYNQDLVFHHTDYEKDIGLTLCRKCHGIVHRVVK
jgi:hypothetical protein